MGLITHVITLVMNTHPHISPPPSVHPPPVLLPPSVPVSSRNDSRSKLKKKKKREKKKLKKLKKKSCWGAEIITVSPPCVLWLCFGRADAVAAVIDTGVVSAVSLSFPSDLPRAPRAHPLPPYRLPCGSPPGRGRCCPGGTRQGTRHGTRGGLTPIPPGQSVRVLLR